jgi:SsrA-binding protein
MGGKVRERGFTLIPLDIYFRKGRAKLTLALARGKRRFDKREAIAKRETERRLRRAVRREARGR